MWERPTMEGMEIIAGKREREREREKKRERERERERENAKSTPTQALPSHSNIPRRINYLYPCRYN